MGVRLVSEFQCKGCGKTNTIVEISLLPSIQVVRPDPAPNHTPFEDLDYGAFENFYEGAPVLGFGCETEWCQFWQGSYGSPVNRDQQPALLFERAPNLADIATIVAE